NSPQPVVVQPNFDGLASGSYRSAVTLLFDDGSIEVVNILAVIAPAGSSAGQPDKADGLREVTGCAPTTLLPHLQQVGFGSTTRVGWPAAVIAKVVDDCGSPLTTGSVVASFDNGDPPLSLTSLQDGSWTGTWQPVHAAGTVTVTVKVQSNGLTGQIK